VDVSPALRLHFPPEITAAERDRLVALLTDHGLIAIQEDDIAEPRTWLAHFDSRAHREAALAVLDSEQHARSFYAEPQDVPDDDWARRTQADLRAIRIGRVTIAPPWDVPAATDPHDIVVVIEPSRGFGTGHHQSTRLCVRCLQDLELAGRTVTDIGTGSGVLAITAAKLGAAQVRAIDSDPDAVENAQENIHRNAVKQLVSAAVEDVAFAAPVPTDVVTANLTGALLVRYAAALGEFANRGGLVVVSGFNVDEREMVTDAFASAFAITRSVDEDDWWAFVMRRRGG
jgi:ribosomal protein L11 methyltransferase